MKDKRQHDDVTRPAKPASPEPDAPAIDAVAKFVRSRAA